MRICVWPMLFAWLGILTRPALADPDLVSVGVGGSDIIGNQIKSAADFRLDYRSGVSLLPYLEQYFKVKPWVGIETTSRAAIWGGGGIWLDIPIGQHWVLSPNIGLGGYDRGAGTDLGSAFEIRSTLEAGYVFDNGIRLTAGFTHMSNAGVVRHNPGIEAVVVSVQVPLVGLFSKR